MRLWRWLAALALALALAPGLVRADDGAEDRVAIGRHLYVASGETVPGAVVVIGGSATLEGAVAGDVVIIGGPLRLNGPVGGQVVVVGGPVILEPGARLDQDLAVIGGPVRRSGGAVAGRVDALDTGWSGASPSVVLTPAPPDLEGPGLGRFLAVRAVQVGLLLALLLVLALGVTLFFPGRLEVIAVTLRAAPLPSALLGLLSFALAAVLTLTLLATLLGAPLALLVGGVLLTGWALGLVALAEEIGERLWEAAFPRHEHGALAALLGMLILALLTLPVFALSPLFGFLLLGLLALPGLGAALLSRAGQAPPGVAESRW